MAKIKEYKELGGVHYSVVGSGQRTVVLLRGLGRWSDHWLGFDERLAETNFRVIAIDNRGVGRSKDLNISWTLRIDELADDVASIIAHEAPSGAHVVGVSLGGMIAIALASFKPQLVRSLTLINASVGGSGYSRISWKALGALASAFYAPSSLHTKLSDVLLGKESAAAIRERLSENWRATDKKMGLMPLNVLKQLAAAARFRPHSQFINITCPTVCVVGDGDRFVDPRNSSFLQKKIRGATIEHHPTGGHELGVEDPAWLGDVIRKHVEMVQSS